MGKFEVYLVRILLEFVMLFFIFFFWLTWFKVIKIRQEPKMKPIAIFTLVIWCIGVESLPGVREKRETKGCSSLVFPSPKRYQVFYEGNWDGPKWQVLKKSLFCCYCFICCCCCCCCCRCCCYRFICCFCCCCC